MSHFYFEGFLAIILLAIVLMQVRDILREHKKNKTRTEPVSLGNRLMTACATLYGAGKIIWNMVKEYQSHTFTAWPALTDGSRMFLALAFFVCLAAFMFAVKKFFILKKFRYSLSLDQNLGMYVQMLTCMIAMIVIGIVLTLH